jgi:hypothetical protein
MTIEQILGLKALDKAVSSFGREDRFLLEEKIDFLVLSKKELDTDE